MSNPSHAGRAIVSRIFFGVTSIGAAYLLYLYYNYHRKKDATAAASDPDQDTITSKRKRRIASGSGENKNRVTFAEQNEIIGFETSGASSGKDQHEDDEDVLVGEVSKAMSSQRQPNYAINGNANEKSPVVVPDLLAEGLPSPKGSRGGPAENKEVETPVKLESILDFSNEAAPFVVVEEEVISTNEEVKVTASGPEKVEDVMVPVEEPVTIASNGYPILQQQIPANVEMITPETDYDRDSMVRQMNIPRDHVPGLIGKKGANIRGIQQTSNTTINFKDETLENGDRVCMIRGRPQDVTIAESMIEKYILEQPIITSHTIKVPVSSVGRIIGKGGESIRGIQDMSKARVTVDSDVNHSRGAGDSTATRSVIIRGTEEQIAVACQMVIDKVEEEKALRRNIEMATQSRTPRRATSTTSNNSPGGSMMHPNSAVNGNSLPLRTNGVMKIFVSCAYHPNDFWIQVVGKESIDLDKLTEAMTEWYSQVALNTDGDGFGVGDLIAAPFDVDGKMYRGKIIKVLADNEAEVIYVDYGDKRILNRSVFRQIHPEFLSLRFQAIQATLNLGCIGDRWTDEVINVFCELTHCAHWIELTAKVKDYLKDPIDQKDTIWIEVFDKDLNVGDELIRQNRAVAKEPLALSTVNTSSNSKKSYAAVVADELKSNRDSVEYDDANGEEAWGEDERNGN